MKLKATILTKLALGIMIAGSISACNQNKSETKSTATNTGSTAKQDIVYINEDSIIQKYDYVKDMTKRMDDKRKAAATDVQSRGQAIQREVAEYRKNAGTMTNDQRASTEQRLQGKGQEFQQYQQNASAQVQNDEMAEQTKLYEKISEFAKQYAKEKGYKLILTYKKGNPTLLYGDPALDITPAALKRLNDAYAKDKK